MTSQTFYDFNICPPFLSFYSKISQKISMTGRGNFSFKYTGRGVIWIENHCSNPHPLFVKLWTTDPPAPLKKEFLDQNVPILKIEESNWINLKENFCFHFIRPEIEAWVEIHKTS